MGYHNCSLHDIGSLDSRIHYIPDRPAVLMDGFVRSYASLAPLCHPERQCVILSVSEGSGAPQRFSPSGVPHQILHFVQNDSVSFRMTVQNDDAAVQNDSALSGINAQRRSAVADREHAVFASCWNTVEYKIASFAVPSKKQGPRTRRFCNGLIYCKIQNPLVRGPLPVSIIGAASRLCQPRQPFIPRSSGRCCVSRS